MNKIITITGLVIAGFLGWLFIERPEPPFVGADDVLDAYTETVEKYEMKQEITDLPAMGEAKVEVMKDEPKVVFSKWDGEVALGVSYPEVQAQSSKDTGSDKVEFIDGAKEFHAYPLEPAKGMEAGGFEVEVILNEKPDKNVFDFIITGYENLDFFYQPELTQEQIDFGHQRPENVVGSYAVYHKTNKNYKLGDKNYATGKAYHIYRPKAFDAGGNEEWAILSYTEGVLSVEVPQDFLDKATYPVRVDPTFGTTTVGASSTNFESYMAGDTAVATESGTGVDITVYMAESDTADFTHNARGMLYADSGSSQATNGATVEDNLWTTAGNWGSLAFSSAPSLTAQTYLAMVMADDTAAGNIQEFYDAASGRGRAEDTTYPTFPASFGGFTQDVLVSIYVTYTAAGGAAATPVPVIIWVD